MEGILPQPGPNPGPNAFDNVEHSNIKTINGNKESLRNILVNDFSSGKFEYKDRSAMPLTSALPARCMIDNQNFE